MKNTNLMRVDSSTLKEWIHDDSELALLDVRESGEFGERHIFLATPLPYSRLEIEVVRLVPRLSTRVVLVDEDGQDLASVARKRLIELGYSSVYILQGGMKDWEKAGFEVYAGVNVPSKAFGELAELYFKTPHISAMDLAEKIQRQEDLVILDGRPISEYKKMSIPSAICCPNGELPLRIDDLVSDPNTPVIVNCAGRTRSIIGAQTLINLGIPNPVFALENGTQGWYLNDLKLNHGANSVFGPLQVCADLKFRRRRAQRLADEYGIVKITASTLNVWLNDSSRTTYFCDVRSPEESSKQPIVSAQPTPGGQLIQATDQYLATRGARIVLVDDEDIRAPVVATWLYMLGWDVYILPTNEKKRLDLNERKYNTSLHKAKNCNYISAKTLAEFQKKGVPIFDIRSSMEYRKVHVSGAIWAIRPMLIEALKRLGTQPDEVVLICKEGEKGELAALDLKELGVQSVYCCEMDIDVWRAAGVLVESTPNSPVDAECIDYLFFVHDRHDGNKDAARRYLAWETNLISQLDEREKAIFRFEKPSTSKKSK